MRIIFITLLIGAANMISLSNDDDDDLYSAGVSDQDLKSLEGISQPSLSEQH